MGGVMVPGSLSGRPGRYLLRSSSALARPSVLVTGGFMTGGGGPTSGARRAQAARERAAKAAADASKAAAEAARQAALAEKYEKGDEGERLVADALDVLHGAGWVALHDRWKSASSPANIDHILVGPPGVCVIDAKNWSSRVVVDERGLRAGAWRKDDQLASVAEQARLVGAVANTAAPGVITCPVLCFVGHVGIASPLYEHGVVILQLDQLLPWLTALPTLVDRPSVARIGQTLEAHFYPRTTSRAGSHGASFARAPGKPPGRPRVAPTPMPLTSTPLPPLSLGARARAALLRGLVALGLGLLALLVLPPVVGAVLKNAASHLPEPPRPSVKLRAHQSISLTASASTLRRGHALSLSGRVEPKRASGVWLQRYVGGRWTILRYQFSGPTGAYVFSYTPVEPGVYVLRTYVAASPTAGDGTSSTRKVVVR